MLRAIAIASVLSLAAAASTAELSHVLTPEREVAAGDVAYKSTLGDVADKSELGQAVGGDDITDKKNLAPPADGDDITDKMNLALVAKLVKEGVVDYSAYPHENLTLGLAWNGSTVINITDALDPPTELVVTRRVTPKKYPKASAELVNGTVDWTYLAHQEERNKHPSANALIDVNSSEAQPIHMSFDDVETELDTEAIRAGDPEDVPSDLVKSPQPRRHMHTPSATKGKDKIADQLAAASTCVDQPPAKVKEATNGDYSSCSEVAAAGVCDNEKARLGCPASCDVCGEGMDTMLVAGLQAKHGHWPFHGHIPHGHIPVARAVKAVAKETEKAVKTVSTAVTTAVDKAIDIADHVITNVASTFEEIGSNIVQAAKATYDAAKKGISAAGKAIAEYTAKVVTDFVENTVAALDAVAQFAEEAATAIAKVAVAIVEAVADFCEAVWNFLQLIFSDFLCGKIFTGEAFKDVYDELQNSGGQSILAPIKSGGQNWIDDFGNPAKVGETICGALWMAIGGLGLKVFLNDNPPGILNKACPNLFKRQKCIMDSASSEKDCVPAFSLGITLDADASAGPFTAGIGIELGLALDSVGTQYCYIGYCESRGFQWPDEAGVSASIGVAFGIWMDAGNIPGVSATAGISVGLDTGPLGLILGGPFTAGVSAGVNMVTSVGPMFQWFAFGASGSLSASPGEFDASPASASVEFGLCNTPLFVKSSAQMNKHSLELLAKHAAIAGKPIEHYLAFNHTVNQHSPAELELLQSASYIKDGRSGLKACGSQMITTAAQCKEAAQSLGLSVSNLHNGPNVYNTNWGPKGCWAQSGTYLQFNQYHGAGGNCNAGFAQCICKNSYPRDFDKIKTISDRKAQLNTANTPVNTEPRGRVTLMSMRDKSYCLCDGGYFKCPKSKKMLPAADLRYYFRVKKEGTSGFSLMNLGTNSLVRDMGNYVKCYGTNVGKDETHQFVVQNAADSTFYIKSGKSNKYFRNNHNLDAALLTSGGKSNVIDVNAPATAVALSVSGSHNVNASATAVALSVSGSHNVNASATAVGSSAPHRRLLAGGDTPQLLTSEVCVDSPPAHVKAYSNGAYSSCNEVAAAGVCHLKMAREGCPASCNLCGTSELLGGGQDKTSELAAGVQAKHSHHRHHHHHRHHPHHQHHRHHSHRPHSHTPALVPSPHKDTWAQFMVQPAPTFAFGARVKLIHANTGKRLRADGTTYPAGSRQNRVGCYADPGPEDWWIVEPKHGDDLGAFFGKPVPDTGYFRLRNYKTGKNLHSHGTRAHRVTSQYEVTTYGTRGIGDSNDDWQLMTNQDGNAGFRFKHRNSGRYLHSHNANYHWGWSGWQEVTSNSGKDTNNLFYLYQVFMPGTQNAFTQWYVNMELKLMHVNTNQYLHSHNMALYKGTKQQEVACFAGAGSNDYYFWKIKFAHASGETSTMQSIQAGDVVRFTHVMTGKNLHSHNIAAPESGGQKEVTGYGNNGSGDSNDDWYIHMDQDAIGSIRLEHKNSRSGNNHGGYLHSHGTKLRGGSRMQEVTRYLGADTNDLWLMDDVTYHT